MIPPKDDEICLLMLDTGSGAMQFSPIQVFLNYPPKFYALYYA